MPVRLVIIAAGFLILCEAVLIAVLTWLNTGKGHDWLQGTINTAMADSGYQLTVDSVGWYFPHGVTIKGLDLADTGGAIAHVDTLSLRPDFLPLVAGRLSLAMRAGTVKITRIPESDASTPATAPEPFTLPDSFLHTVDIDDLYIDTLDLPAAVAGVDMLLSPRLSVRVGFDEHIDLRLRLKLDQKGDHPVIGLPERFGLRAIFDPATLKAYISSLTASSLLYRIDANGEADITADTIDIAVIGRTQDLAQIAEAASGYVAFSGNVSGQLTNPTITLDTLPRLYIFDTIGVADMKAKLTLRDLAHDLRGDIDADFTLLGHSSTLTTYFSLPDTFDINDILIKTANATLSGKLSINTDTGLMTGKVIAESGDLDALSHLDLLGRARVTAGFTAPDGVQILSLDVALNDVAYGDISLSSVQASTVWPLDKDLPDHADLRIGGLRFMDDMSLEKMSAHIAYSPDDIYTLTADGRGHARQDFNFTLSAAVENMNTPTPTMSEMKLNLRTQNPTLALHLQSTYIDNLFNATLNVTGDHIRRLDGHLQVPVKITITPFAIEYINGGTLDGSLNMQAALAPLSAQILPPTHDLRGDMTLNATLAGTIKSPLLHGRLALDNGSYSHDLYSLQLGRMKARAAFDHETLTLESLTANDNADGTLSAKGLLALQDPRRTALSLRANNFHLLRGDNANGKLSAALDFTGKSTGDYLLKGTIDIGPLEVTVPEQFHQSIPELNIVAREGIDPPPIDPERITLDIIAKADNRIFVRGWGLDSEFAGHIAISGTAYKPELTGTLGSIRGRYEEFGRRFTLERANLRFQGEVPPSPYFDISAVANINQTKAYVKLGGSLQKPAINFSANPPMPEDEVLAYILFGRDMSNISPFQAIQLKNTLDRFSGRGGNGFDPLGRLRGMTGFDDIRIDSQEEGASVGVGKYLSDNVYIEFESGAGSQAGSANLQIELTPNISLGSKIGGDAQSGAGISWKWDY